MPMIALAERINPRYLYINPKTNYVHLFVPLVQGQEISTDNTCRLGAALNEFKLNVLGELNTYKSELECDLQLLEDSSPLKALKKTRLMQINAYIRVLPEMQDKYSNAITSQMQIISNLYSMQLRPHIQDSQSKVERPTFSVERTNDVDGNPKSALYNAMYKVFPNTQIAPLDPKSLLETAVLGSQPCPVSFSEIQLEMTNQCQRLFGINVDFTQKM